MHSSLKNNPLKFIPQTNYSFGFCPGVSFQKNSFIFSAGLEIGKGTDNAHLVQTFFPGGQDSTTVNFGNFQGFNQIISNRSRISTGLFVNINYKEKNWFFTLESSFYYDSFSLYKGFFPKNISFPIIKIDDQGFNHYMGSVLYYYNPGKHDTRCFTQSFSIKAGKFIGAKRNVLVQGGLGINGQFFSEVDEFHAEYYSKSAQLIGTSTFYNRMERICLNLSITRYFTLNNEKKK